MALNFDPSRADVHDHLSHLRSTAHLPPWQRGHASLELLLGLGEPAIDAELRAIAPQLGARGGDWSLDADFVLSLLADSSAERVARVVERTHGALALAWFTPEKAELSELLNRLSEFITQRARPFGSPAVHLSLCELLRRTFVEAPPAFRAIVPSRWLERTAWAAALRADRPTVNLAAAEAWLPDCPPALIRDPLTGLLSRSVLSRNPHRFHLPDESEIVSLPKDGVVMLDVDRMRHILDVHELLTGDDVLRTIADALQRRFGDNVIRFGGDEFLIVCDGGALKQVASDAVETVRALSIGVHEPEERVRVTVSAGASAGTSPLETLRAAEHALARAKDDGRDRFVVV